MDDMDVFIPRFQIRTNLKNVMIDTVKACRNNRFDEIDEDGNVNNKEPEDPNDKKKDKKAPPKKKKKGPPFPTPPWAEEITEVEKKV